MNEDAFNASLRKFLKKVGITSQREIEKVVRDAISSGRLKGHEKLPAKWFSRSVASAFRTRLPATSSSARKPADNHWASRAP